jgi:phage repressor protein C with HTH and peptisase S24 domain
MSDRLRSAQPTLGDRIRQRREYLGLTRENIARHFDISPDEVERWESGETTPEGRRLRELRALLRCSVQWLLTGETARPEPAATGEAPPGYAAVRSIAPRAGESGRGFVESEALGPPKFFEERLIRELRAQPADLRAIEIEGESMEPLLRNGDQVLVDTRKTGVVEPGLFVVFDGAGLVCKWVERARGAAGRKLRLTSENPRFGAHVVDTDADARVIGRVVWLSRRL